MAAPADLTLAGSKKLSERVVRVFSTGDCPQGKSGGKPAFLTYKTKMVEL